MATVVVLGAGLGGIPTAYELRKKLDSGHRVVMVGSSEYFEFTPSNPWIAVGWRTREQTRVDMRRPFDRKGVEFIPELATAIDAPHLGQIQRAIKLMLKSKKPVLYVGGGIISSNASKELTVFVERLGIPVTMTLMGLGGFPANHSLSLGMLGMHGTYWANMAVMESDLLIAIGARFDDRVTGKTESFAPHAKIIHIDIDPTSISKNVKVDLPIVGDCKNVLAKMLSLLGKEEADSFTLGLGNWYQHIDRWKKIHDMNYKQGEVIKPQYVVEKICSIPAAWMRSAPGSSGVSGLRTKA